MSLKRKILEGAQKISKTGDIGIDDVYSIIKPLASLITAETGVNVEIVIRVKNEDHNQRQRA